MITHRMFAIGLLACLLAQLTPSLNAFQQNGCYGRNNEPVRCLPDFVNAAYNKTVLASNTCGSYESEYCVQTNRYSDIERCDICDLRRPDKSHPAEYLNDYKNEAGLTWWQSDTMEYGIQDPGYVNITIHLGKAFDLTYIQVKFMSSRPESFAIYKRTSESSEWEPYQYYSASCYNTYKKEANGYVQKGNEAVALCSDEFSDIAPLSGGSVAFSTLEGRPSAYDFEGSEELKNWVTATDIKLTLNRLNTFGDDIFGDPKVLRSYFYAISDISIGGRCKCNGHAEKCIEFEDNNFETRLKCACEHNTDGVDCEKCAPFYNDQPWAAATYEHPFKCEPCNCNGLSDRCEFREDIWLKTGHGGYCLNCTRNTEGQFCENCKHGFYRRENDNECLDCQCHSLGSVSVQCAPNGQCICRPGVTGLKCDQCMPNHYDLTIEGCKECQCNSNGSYHSPARCNPINGKCYCKDHVEGQNCDRCKPGFFNLDANLTSGCSECFCFGHSSQCSSAFNFIANDIKAGDLWTATNLDGSVHKTVQFDNDAQFIYNTDEDIWFNAPAHVLGNQRISYNRRLSFTLKFKLDHSSAIRKDLILEGNGKQVYMPIYDSINYELPADPTQILPDITHDFSIKLNEYAGWRPALSKNDFQRVLSNLTALRIKTTYGGLNFLSNFNLESARSVPTLAIKNQGLEKVTWVENCACPEQYTGQFCENCQVGFTRELPGADSFSRCVPCSCNNHSIACNPTNGKCDCIHNTMGENCEMCRDGYYGNALVGSPIDCKECPCPDRGPCAEIYNYQSEAMDVVCLACPEGTRGNLCDMCEDGYYGFDGYKCTRCDCNGNIDENAIGNCDSVTGQCLRCTQNTTGDQCTECLTGYWGDALTDIKCHACECHVNGSNSAECNLADGQCSCKANVVGRQCDQCEDTFWNLDSGEGCEECKCSPLGSVSLSCDKQTGQCQCQPGVTGAKCDQCMSNHFNFSGDGCQPCACNDFGSIGPECDYLGRCLCKNNIAGDKCDRCQENYSNFTLGCLKCENCYDLVQEQVTDLRDNINMIMFSLDVFKPSDVPEEAQEKNRELKILLVKVQGLVGTLHSSLFSNGLKPTYMESLKQAQATFAGIDGEVKELTKAIEVFDSELDKFHREKKTLKALQNKNDLLSSSYISTLYSLQAHLVDIEENAKSKPIDANLVEIKKFAKESREASMLQQKIADELATKVRTYMRQCRDSIFKLDMLMSEISNSDMAAVNTGNELAIKEAVELTNEASDLKAKIDEDAKAILVKSLALKNLGLAQKEQQADVDIHEAIEQVEEKNELINHLIGSERELSENVRIYVASINQKLTDAQDKIKTVENMENDMSKLLERAKKAQELSDKAIELANESFNSAKNTLGTYENFERVHMLNMDAAAEASKLTADININLNECRISLDQASGALSTARVDKAQAEENTRQANLLVDSASPQSLELEAKIEALEPKQTELEQLTASLTARATKNAEELAKAKSLNETFGSRFSQLQQSVETVGINSNILLTTLNDADTEANNMNTNYFKNMNGVTEETVRELESKFEDILNQSEESVELLDSDMEDITERTAYHQQLLVIYEREIPELRKQITDLQLLQSSLDAKCNYYLKRKLRR